jgi:hypothetical protein
MAWVLPLSNERYRAKIGAGYLQSSVQCHQAFPDRSVCTEQSTADDRVLVSSCRNRKLAIEIEHAAFEASSV